MKTDGANGVGEILEAVAEIRDLDASQAQSLPTGFYTSEEYHELEKEEIFRKEWVCLGLVAEIPKRGDYFTTQLLDEPLIVARGQDNKVRVLSNVCRHRSSVIVEGKEAPNTSSVPITPGPTPTTASSCARPTWTRSRPSTSGTAGYRNSRPRSGTASSMSIWMARRSRWLPGSRASSHI